METADALNKLRTFQLRRRVIHSLLSSSCFPELMFSTWMP